MSGWYFVSSLYTGFRFLNIRTGRCELTNQNTSKASGEETTAGSDDSALHREAELHRRSLYLTIALVAALIIAGIAI